MIYTYITCLYVQYSYVSVYWAPVVAPKCWSSRMLTSWTSFGKISLEAEDMKALQAVGLCTPNMNIVAYYVAKKIRN